MTLALRILTSGRFFGLSARSFALCRFRAFTCLWLARFLERSASGLACLPCMAGVLLVVGRGVGVDVGLSDDFATLLTTFQ